jgi:hypothetical protein
MDTFLSYPFLSYPIQRRFILDDSRKVLGLIHEYRKWLNLRVSRLVHTLMFIEFHYLANVPAIFCFPESQITLCGQLREASKKLLGVFLEREKSPANHQRVRPKVAVIVCVVQQTKRDQFSEVWQSRHLFVGPKLGLDGAYPHAEKKPPHAQAEKLAPSGPFPARWGKVMFAFNMLGFGFLRAAIVTMRQLFAASIRVIWKML